MLPRRLLSELATLILHVHVFRHKDTWKANVWGFVLLCGCLTGQDGLCGNKLMQT